MKRRSFRLTLILLPVLVGAGAAMASADRPVRAESAAREVMVPGSVRGHRAASMLSGSARRRGTELSARTIPGVRPMTRAAVRQEIRRAREGTYIDELLLARDSALVRWPARIEEPIAVWIQPVSRVKDFDARFPRQARAAFRAWSATGIPVEFEFVADSADADVHVSWVDRFREPVSGKTLWARDGRWWMVDANILLATHHSGGDPLDPSAIRALALHEVGHLLGLDHTTDPWTIMTPRVRVRELSPADRATARLLYSLPPGSVR